MKYYEIEFTIKSCNKSNAFLTDGEEELLMENVKDVIAACAGDVGFESFEDTGCTLKGYIQTDLFDKEALDTLLENLPFENISIITDIKEAENKDWNETWENEGFPPIIIGSRCVIHDGRHIPTDINCDIRIEIDARMAFGTGTHETTRMVLSELFECCPQGKSVLDCGCGTGILGIAALKCGAEKVVGYDIDEWSVENTHHNAIINNVEDRYTTILGNASILDKVYEKYDIVVANINRNILLADMPSFKKKMKDDGILILSGFYITDIPMIKNKVESLRMKCMKSTEDNNWACVVIHNA